MGTSRHGATPGSDHRAIAVSAPIGRTERDVDGRAALAIAVLRADVPLVKLLLASGANRRAVDRFGQTPLS
jgi:hypothetical protein